MAELAVQQRPGIETTRHGGRRRRGRPTSYNEEVARAICEAIRRGGTQQAAANAQGLSRDTILAWAAERDDFSDMLARAEGDAELAYSGVCYDHAVNGKPGDGWRPAIEVLKRRYKGNGWGDTLDLRKVDVNTLAQLLQSQTTQEAITEPGEPALLTADDVL